MPQTSSALPPHDGWTPGVPPQPTPIQGYHVVTARLAVSCFVVAGSLGRNDRLGSPSYPRSLSRSR